VGILIDMAQAPRYQPGFYVSASLAAIAATIAGGILYVSSRPAPTLNSNPFAQAAPAQNPVNPVEKPYEPPALPISGDPLPAASATPRPTATAQSIDALVCDPPVAYPGSNGNTYNNFACSLDIKDPSRLEVYVNGALGVLGKDYILFKDNLGVTLVLAYQSQPYEVEIKEGDKTVAAGIVTPVDLVQVQSEKPGSGSGGGSGGSGGGGVPPPDPGDGTDVN
jgi:hypothetical protein